MFYKETQDPMPDKDGKKLWRPEIVRTGETMDIEDLSKLISTATTLTKADISAVLYSLPQAMNLYLKEGHTVRLNGIGTYNVYGRSRGNGVESKDDVRPSQFGTLSIKFWPEYTLSPEGNREYPLLADIKFVNIKHLLKQAGGSGGDDNGGTPETPETPGGGGNEPETPGGGGGGYIDPDA
jgi:predicted histone-like DNA-binding protein